MKEEAAARAIHPGQDGDSKAVNGPQAVKGRLLLVDDEPHILEGLTLHLRRNYAIVARRSATDALRALATEGPFVAVVSDLRMPGMDGVQFLVEVKRRAPHTCRLLLTGHGDMATAVTAVNEAGVHRLLTKPCPPAVLAAALEEAIAAERASSLPRPIHARDVLAPPPRALGILAEPLERGASPATEDIGILDLPRLWIGDWAQGGSPSNRHNPVLEDVEIGALVCAARDALDGAACRMAKIQVTLPEQPVHVRGDAAVLEAMVLNLLKNATDAIYVGAKDRGAIGSLLTRARPDPTIWIRVSSVDRTARVEVIDNGRAIADTNLDRLFDAYVATKRAESGAGLGLAIVRETVSRYQGKIWAEILPEGGNRFVVELPLADIADEPEGAESEIRELKAE